MARRDHNRRGHNGSLDMITITTARLNLRPFTLADLDEYQHAIFGDADVIRYLPASALSPRDRAEAAIKRFTQQWIDRGFGMLAIDRLVDDDALARAPASKDTVDPQPARRLIGHCGLQPLENTPEIEVAYALAKAYWGQGLATEAARAMLRFGFEQMRLERIVAIALQANIASQRVMQKLGMKYVKDARHYAAEVVFYAITREEYRALYT
jgi:ribosomal-protein-alanine N-acetyltransferase